MARVLVHIKPKNVRWWKKDPEGTMEEKIESYDKANDYLYKILDYCERETPDDDEIKQLRRDFAFLKQGPWAGHFIAASKHKLTSADVLYILTSTLPAKIVANKYGIDFEEVRRIRRGDLFHYYNEYLLVRRLTAIIKAKIRNDGTMTGTRKFYTLSKLVGADKYEHLYAMSSMRKAKATRKDVITKAEYKKLEKDNMLDIMYPIKELDII